MHKIFITVSNAQNRLLCSNKEHSAWNETVIQHSYFKKCNWRWNKWMFNVYVCMHKIIVGEFLHASSSLNASSIQWWLACMKWLSLNKHYSRYHFPLSHSQAPLFSIGSVHSKQSWKWRAMIVGVNRFRLALSVFKAINSDLSRWSQLHHFCT